MPGFFKIEEVKDKREQIKYKELRRGSAKRIRKSKECDKLTKQISVLKGDIRQLELEIKINTKKTEKSKWCQGKKVAQLPTLSPEPNSSSSNFFSSVPSSLFLTDTVSWGGQKICSTAEPMSDENAEVQSEDDRSTVLVSSDESADGSQSPVHVPRLRREDAFIQTSSASLPFW